MRGDALLLWSDAAARRRAIDAIVGTFDAGEAGLADAVQWVDDTVVAGLQALGLPRGDIRGLVRINATLRPYGEKKPDCELILSGWHIRRLVADTRGPDTTFRTWVHESLHARQPYSERYREEYGPFRGEEGMVEGLARMLVRE